MTRWLAALLLLGAAPSPDAARWGGEAARIRITRDDWGIAHVHGVSDADAVFGASYAQAEDDFPRIEANYLAALGRTAEADGEQAIWADLRQRLWVDPAALRRDWAGAPGWLRALTQAWADGLNYYLAMHPDVHPRVLTRFEPWMALSFTEGSIGGDIEKVDLARLAAFYGGGPALALARPRDETEPSGSNGIAIGPGLSASGHPLLLINPHTSFFFRSELGMASDAGLHAYGASTWGQFFLYQGFNERLGWMHTTSGVDSVDEFAEKPVETRAGPPAYQRGAAIARMTATPITIAYRTPDGGRATRTFRTFATVHGPITRIEGGRWIATALMWKPVAALEQSWLRTTARTQAAYLKVAALRANSSNNTVYADADGHIALLHPQFVPMRDDRLDYRHPVDGSDPAADWRGLTPMAKLPQVRDPRAGWLYNSNDAPWRAAGADSPEQAAFPRYMDQAGANFRGDHATALLGRARALDERGLRAIAFDSWMPMFLPLIERLRDWFGTHPDEARRVAAPWALLTRWDDRWSAGSTATTLANYWAAELLDAARHAGGPGNVYNRIRAMPAADVFAGLERGADKERAAWGSLDVPWGKVNCFQRNDAAIEQRFSDDGPCLSVPFASANWGSLASFGARPYPGTRRWYGTSGNSFVAIVEFGPRVRAWSVTAGGESGHPGDPHFTDQAGHYAAGDLKPVYFWPDELAGHVERTYRPGEEAIGSRQ
ncbi:penicillin acylase family protein [Sphingomonas bacterium]|uniref:penicillin acylase family protein n=1 Tax=Sphingomonas bacterium TaxID=1895847 RepID=UPI001C2D2461|nr:penicillin acylase family protein [Sphingomonas bacterium]